MRKRKKPFLNQCLPADRNLYVTRWGYEKWNPFEKPKDPIDIRRDKSRRTSQMLVREFLQSRPMEGYSNSYGRGVLEMAIGIINDDDRFIGMYEFALWHKKLIEVEGCE
jgi:hypothetical protein